MGTTSLTVKEQSVERLDNHRHSEDPSWDATVNGMMDILPTVEDVHGDGCRSCGETPAFDAPLPEVGGYIQFTQVDVPGGDTAMMSMWFCSKDCVRDAADEQEKYAARDPDEVIIGGKDEHRVTTTDASFHLDADQMEVGLSMPGAFSGTSDHGDEYDYVGEPVFVKNRGEHVHSGTISDIIHEESHTAIIIDHVDGRVNALLYHPDEDKRKEERETWADWRDAECPECGEEFQWCAPQDFDWSDHDARDECHECGAEIDPEDYDQGDGEPGVPPWEEDE